jgi:methylphosphotriester-DNA--protein-cysteine methyltransferase
MSNEELVVEIKKFIRINLRTVTLASIQEQFKLDYYVVNNLQKDFSPAKHIRQERNLKAKELFQKKEDISKISNLTGYSESYLLRNKHIYLKL